MCDLPLHQLEALENRRLLSAAVVLLVTGSQESDTILVALDGDTLRVTENGHVSEFARGQVSRIIVDADDGHDFVDLRDAKIPSKVEGGDGDDTIYGSGKADRLDGGDGDDSIKGYKGNDDLRGDDGEDTLRGGADNDSVRGGENEDDLFGDDGADFLDADDDLWEDEVFGGAGNDRADVDDDLGISDDVEDVEDVNT